MRRKAFSILIIILLISCSENQLTNEQACDNGTHIGNVTLLSQQEVIDFGALCYSKINGTLNIGSPNLLDNDINDLSPLSGITEIYSQNVSNGLGSLGIYYSNNLNDLSGLENIESVGRLIIQNNSSFTNLNGLNGLEIVNIDFPDVTNQGIIIEFCSELINLDGLESLERVGNTSYSELFGDTAIRIRGNTSLQSVDGLNNLIEVYGDFRFYTTNDFPVSIIGNPNLANYCSLQNLFTNGVYENVFINGGLYNPTVQDIIEGNCSL